MRRCFVFLCLMFAAPGVASADPFLSFQSGNSRLDYGSSQVVHFGLSIFEQGSSGNLFAEFQTLGGPLLSHSVEISDTGGATSTYLYAGGTFVMDILFEHGPEGLDVVTGSLVTSIIGPIKVTVLEDDSSDSGDSVTISYLLGPGLLDPSVARAIGIGQHIVGGTVIDPFLTFGTGDPSSPIREAFEGASFVDMVVPEPAIVLLSAPALAGELRRRRRR